VQFEVWVYQSDRRRAFNMNCHRQRVVESATGMSQTVWSGLQHPCNAFSQTASQLYFCDADSMRGQLAKSTGNKNKSLDFTALTAAARECHVKLPESNISVFSGSRFRRTHRYFRRRLRTMATRPELASLRTRHQPASSGWRK
jgi:hypothetical protein